MAVREHNPLQRRLYLPIVSTNGTPASTERKPPWLKVRLQRGPNYRELEGIMRTRSLHTVCEEAMCPNISECWEEREATFLILGDTCTRRCGFCDVMTAKPDPVDQAEPDGAFGPWREPPRRDLVGTRPERQEPPLLDEHDGPAMRRYTLQPDNDVQ